MIDDLIEQRYPCASSLTSVTPSSAASWRLRRRLPTCMSEHTAKAVSGTGASAHHSRTVCAISAREGARNKICPPEPESFSAMRRPVTSFRPLLAWTQHEARVGERGDCGLSLVNFPIDTHLM